MRQKQEERRSVQSRGKGSLGQDSGQCRRMNPKTSAGKLLRLTGDEGRTTHSGNHCPLICRALQPASSVPSPIAGREISVSHGLEVCPTLHYSCAKPLK